MHLIRFGSKGQEKPGILDASQKRRDARPVLQEFDVNDWGASFWQQATAIMAALQAKAESLPLVSDSERWGAPVPRPGKIICVGLNYADHAKEANIPLPDEPVLFMKAPNTVVGPYDPILIPRGSEKTDWEVELGVIIGKEARYLDTVERSKEHIGGYCISHDVSERAFQIERSGQWTKGKSCDTFSPLGPWVATPDEVPDIFDTELNLKVNGTTRQASRTSQMVWGPEYLVHYISQFMTLEVGDLISTGTPFGVGMGTGEYLKAGDQTELHIPGLGTQKQVCENA